MERFSSTCNDILTPRWRQRIKAGDIINNPCTIVVDHQQVNESGSFYTFQTSNPSNVYQVYGDGSVTQYFLDACVGTPDYGDLDPDMSEVLQSLKQQAVARIDSTPYAFLEDLGEIGETIRFIKSPLSGLLKYSRRFAKARKSLLQYRGRYKAKSVTNVAKANAELWLEYRFAVMPLVRSILSFFEARDAEVYRPERRTARANKYVDLSTPLESQSIPYYSSNHCLFNVGTIVERTIRVGILYEVENPGNDLLFKYGLRIKDIPETAWNLLPLSFMVDRLVNISASFRGVTNLFDPNVKTLTGWITTFNNTVKQTALTRVIETGYTGSVTPDLIYEKAFTYSRSLWEPGLIDTIPVLNATGLVKSATRTADLVSLIASTFIGNKAL
jgi:hypothetical protein